MGIVVSKNPFDKYVFDKDNTLMIDGKIPLVYWPYTENFGDEISPWLFRKISGLDIHQNDGSIPSYVGVGSVIDRVRDQSIVWGSGSFGPEAPRHINKNATYCAVRGPLTRSRILDRRGTCPRIYGDPALLVPYFKKRQTKKTHEIGLVLRWSDKDWLKQEVGDGVKLIDLGTDEVDRVVDEMTSCKRIITSSLHGLIIADAYGIPNAWLFSSSPKGFEFKFYDYFLSVNKVRHSTAADLTNMTLDVENLDNTFEYDARKIDYDPEPLVAACPLLKPKS